MGQQQLLLIVLGVIIVGIAIVVGINLFNANAVSSNRDAITSDLQNLAAMAHQFYVKPTAMGGGGNSFVGCFDGSGNLPTGMSTNANGTYTIKTAGSSTGIVIEGVGTQPGNGGTVTMDIYVKVPPLTDSLATVH